MGSGANTPYGDDYTEQTDKRKSKKFDIDLGKIKEKYGSSPNGDTPPVGYEPTHLMNPTTGFITPVRQ